MSNAKKKTMIEIDIILLGNIKNSIDKNYLKNWYSNIFKINTISELELLADEDFTDPNCKYEKVENSIKANRLTFAVSNYYFAANLISYRLNEQLINLSIYDFEKVLLDEKLRIEKFLLRFIYGIVTIYSTNNNKLPEKTSIIHTNVKGCLFDFCKRHNDTLKFHLRPMICSESIAELEKMQKPENLIDNLKIEINSLGRTSIEKTELWVKQNQALTAIITTAIGFILGLLTNMIR